MNERVEAALARLLAGDFRTAVVVTREDARFIAEALRKALAEVEAWRQWHRSQHRRLGQRDTDPRDDGAKVRAARRELDALLGQEAEPPRCACGKHALPKPGMLWGSEDTLHGRSRCTPMGREPARETP